MTNKINRVSEPVIRRLPIYHRFLTEILNKGIERISSSELGNITGFTASQIRQDFNNFGGFGQQGYGYNVENLRNEIGSILGLDLTYRTVIIGAGRLGTAVARYEGFRSGSFKVKALFDSNKELQGKKVGDIPIYNIENMEDFLKNNSIDVLILTVPGNSAQSIVDRAISSKIKGIWNFAPVEIEVPNHIIVENIRLNDSLLKLSYYLKKNNV